MPWSLARKFLTEKICRCAFHDAPIFKVVAFNVALFDAILFHVALCYYNIIWCCTIFIFNYLKLMLHCLIFHYFHVAPFDVQLCSCLFLWSLSWFLGLEKRKRDHQRKKNIENILMPLIPWGTGTVFPTPWRN